MRIAVNASIVDEAPTGLGLYAINVVRELITILDVSDEVTVFTGYSPAFSDLGVRIVNTGRLARPSFGRLGGVYRFLWCQSVLPTLALTQGHDVIYHLTHHGFPYHVPGSPQVLTIQSDVDATFSFPKQHRLQYLYFRYVVPHLIAASAAVITTSAYALKRLAARYRESAARFRFAYNAVDPELFTPRGVAEDAHTLRTLGLRAQQYILTVNASYPHKNVETLLRAFVVAHSACADLRLCIAGYKRSYLDTLLEAIPQNARAGIVRLEYVPQRTLAQLYRGALCLVITSLHESFGMPCVEAMASGCPVIASNASALPEVCGDAAMFVAPRDWSHTSELIVEAVKNPASLDPWRKRGIARAANFSWKHTARAAYDVLRQVHQVRHREAAGGGTQDLGA